jgi:hypothetical protein
MARNTFYEASKQYYDTIRLVSGDTKPELNITLRDSNTAATGLVLDASDPTTWKIIDLTNVEKVEMNFKKVGSSTIKETILCTIVSPKTDGKIIMQWTTTSLDSVAGEYEGEIVITDTTAAGGKVITVRDLLKFDIRARF